MLTEDLVTLGYLEPGVSPVQVVTRAIVRFQRHAQRKYRKTAAGESVEEAPVYAGPEDGVPQQSTMDEIARWLQKGFRLPLGYFKWVRVETWGWLREDVAAAWLELMARIKQLGGTIDGPYGDTRRPLMHDVSVGASKFSFHVCGRAVDLNQSETRFHVAQEPRDGQMSWRIYCKTQDQSGAQGVNVTAGSVTCYDFADRRNYPLPAGYYLDLTAEIERLGLFERIFAQHGWQEDPRRCEWWHFQWVPEKQKTFQDECELAGISEKQLRAAGYTDSDLDHPPG